MQLSCQPFKNMPIERYIPSFLIFMLCPLILFLHRYSVVVLVLATIYSLFYIKNTWTRADVENMLRRQISPTCSIERYLNYGLLFVTLFDFFRPYESYRVDIQIIALLTAGFLWWHAIRQNLNTPSTYIKPILYGIITCCLFILIDHALGSLLVTSAEKMGKGRALIFSNVAMTLSLAVWPVVWNQAFWKTGVLCALLIAFIMPILDCDAASASLIVGLCAYGIASIEAKLFWRIVQVKIVILCLTLPFLLNTFLTDKNIHEINKILPSYSSIHRLYIWQYVSQKIMERPLIGFGIDAGTQEAVGGKIITKPFYWEFKNGEGVNSHPVHSKQIPTHPHNAILQWWLEGGAIGALWWAALLVFLVEKISVLPTLSRKITFAFFSSNMMIMLVSIGFWQSWWWATWLLLLPFLTISKK
ncbi:MAG: O-antigen ligase family protein [Pseudomonadota bacterium]